MSTDKLAATGALFFLLVLAAYVIIFFVQYKNMTAESERITVLLTRTASFLPWYSFFMLISLAAPQTLAAMSVPIAVIEGYSFYNFLAALVNNLGGPAKVVEAIQGRPLFCCTSYCPTEPDKFYNKTVWAMFYFVALRPCVIVLAAIAYYAKSAAGKLFYVLFTLVGVAMLVYSLIHFVLLYESVYEKSKNLKGILKVMLLKFSVGLIVLQGLIQEFMITAKAEPYNDDSQWDKEEKVQRGYAILVLLEFVILIVPYLIGFLPAVSPALARDPGSLQAPSAPTFFHFLCGVVSFHDIFGVMAYTDSMNQSLTSNQK